MISFFLLHFLHLVKNHISSIVPSVSSSMHTVNHVTSIYIYSRRSCGETLMLYLVAFVNIPVGVPETSVVLFGENF